MTQAQVPRRFQPTSKLSPGKSPPGGERRGGGCERARGDRRDPALRPGSAGGPGGSGAGAEAAGAAARGSAARGGRTERGSAGQRLRGSRGRGEGFRSATGGSGRVLTYAVFFLPFGGNPTGHGAGLRGGARAPAPYAAIFPPRDGKSFYRRRNHVVRAEPAGGPGAAGGARGERPRPSHSRLCRPGSGPGVPEGVACHAGRGRSPPRSHRLEEPAASRLVPTQRRAGRGGASQSISLMV